MKNSFEDKTVIITGAASGIGAATALLFAGKGAKVVVSDQNPAGEEVANEINRKGGEAIFTLCDVSKADQVESMVAACVSRFGRLDIAFNNAGTEGKQERIHEGQEENWDKVINVNLKGVWLCMKHEVPRMLANGGGTIVNCSSVAGKIAMPQIGPYVASKHGVIGLTKTAALEYARQNIRVNAVCPGVIETPMIDRYCQGKKETYDQLKATEPVGRFGRPEEVANAVLWLCSENSTFVTGDAINVDGGWLAH